MTKLRILFLACVMLTLCASVGASVGDGFYCGVVQEGKFYHDGRGEWISFFFVDVGEAQHDRLVKNLGEAYYESGEYEVKSEIHIYTTNKNISLKDYVGKKISFKGEFFEAHTMNHGRDIVFEIKELRIDSAP